MEEHGGLTKAEALRQFESVHYACAALYGAEGARAAREYTQALTAKQPKKPLSKGPKSPHRR